MSAIGLVEAISLDPDVARVIEEIAPHTHTRLAVPEAAIPGVVAALAQAKRKSIVLTASDRGANEMAAQLRDLVPHAHLAVFPAWETLPHERLSPSTDTVGARMKVLRTLTHDSTSSNAIDLLVVPIRAALQPFVAGLGDIEPIVAHKGSELPMDDFIRKLIEFGFDRVDIVDRRGQFAVRGGIVDVFPAVDDHPVRVEYWGDVVDDIRRFSVADQRSIPDSSSELWITPCRELLPTQDVRQRAAKLAVTHPEIGEILEKISEGIPVEGMESLIPVLVDKLELLFDVCGPEWLIIEAEPERLALRAAELVTTGQEFLEASWHNAIAGNATPIDLGASGFREYYEIKDDFVRHPWVELSTLTGPDDVIPALEATHEYRSQMDDVISDIRVWWAEGFTVGIVMAGHGSAERVVDTLREFNIPARLVDQISRVGEPGLVYVTTGQYTHGVKAKAGEFVLLTEVDLFGQRDSSAAPRSMPSRRRTTIDPLTLKAGDFVVHDQHGVGRYVEMSQRTVGDVTREYLVIEYAPSKRGQAGDKLFVPSDQLDHVTKYIGGESPSLHRLGGADWAKTKSKARKAVRQIAGELIRLYAARMASKGHAFGPDTPWQRELEDAFEYSETPDQMATIQEVKHDMELDMPMDRLVCGDVGYGKTEIAVRAAFKAIQDGKQVAILVPTTLLVQQHMETFSRRYAQFPVRLSALSRFQSDKEVKATFAGINDGSIDIVIGTHRLFSPEVRFKDLGLVIVDEEQRFGVEHKEHLKALRANVDMLTMSATPIPRTLEMAVTGLREMSTIQTPPEDRHPVLTAVGPYDDKQIAAAIHRELLRDGQVYFVHNRVESINRVASRLGELVPEARIVVAHGQMNEHQLEQIIVDFWERKFDVLVSTTIIESGLDIPNANTLIVDRADRFGLSQLHQLRGRVGRSRERGYAYFLYPSDKPLTENAHDRLATIAAHTDLGSGMAVAMKDLEIRGAGNLLGGEQSGHIADVGFDLYVRLVSEAVAEVRDGKPATEEAPIRIELPIDAHIPHDYIREERLRLQAYRQLADTHDEQTLEEVVAELVDRFGPIPEPVQALVAIAQLRPLLSATGVTDVISAGNTVRFSPVELPESRSMRLTRLYPGSLIKPATRTIIVPRPKPTQLGLGAKDSAVSSVEVINWVRTILDTVISN